MKKTSPLHYMLPLLLVLCAPALSYAQAGCPGSTDLNDCINFRIKSVVKAKIDQTSGTKQTETPSISANSTSLVDESSAPDLVGVALNLAGLSATSQGEDEEPDSLSVTATTYSLFSTFKSFDPLNPHLYNKHRNWRRLSFTLGYDDEDKPDGSGGTQRAKLFGAKYLLINRRDPNRSEFEGDLNQVLTKLQTATVGFNTVINRYRNFVFKYPAVTAGIVEPGFTTFLTAKEVDANDALAAARRIKERADSASTASAARVADVAAAVKTAAETEIAASGSALRRQRLTRANAVELNRAAEAAARDPQATPAVVASAVAQALTGVQSRTQGTLDSIAALRQQMTQAGSKELFNFANGFAISTGPQQWSEEEQEYYNEFIGQYSAGAGFEELKKVLGDDFSAEIDRLLEAEVENFVLLQKTSLKVIERIRTAPQLSFAYFTKQRGVGADEHKGELIFDWGLADRLNLTVNGAFEYNDSKTVGGDTRVGGFGAKLKYQVNRNDLKDLLRNSRPVFFDLAAQGKWGNGLDSILKAQAKLTIPIFDTGLELPLSLTVANRTQLVDEMEVRGQFGFTFDFSKLVKALVPAVIPR